MFRVVFFGTSDFAVPSLKSLTKENGFDVVGVVTQPDRPVGRHAELTPPAVKVAAQELGIKEIIQPEKLKEESFQSWIKDVGPSCDAFVIVSYGKILPQWLLDLPKKGVVNVHGSSLPRWRGASPIQAAISSGDAQSGVTIMLIDAEMDHGPILAISETQIMPDDTGGSLHDRLAQMGAELLPMTLVGYLDSTIVPEEQDHSAATHCKILSRDDGKIDWTKSAYDIERQIRAYHPWPGTWTLFEGKRLKIQKAAVIVAPTVGGMTEDSFKPGQCFTLESQPAVTCADGTGLLLLEVQREGKSVSSGQDFLRGIKGWENTVLA